MKQQQKQLLWFHLAHASTSYTGWRALIRWCLMCVHVLSTIHITSNVYYFKVFILDSIIYICFGSRELFCVQHSAVFSSVNSRNWHATRRWLRLWLDFFCFIIYYLRFTVFNINFCPVPSHHMRGTRAYIIFNPENLWCDNNELRVNAWNDLFRE